MPIVVSGFYSLKHAAKRLGITQSDLRELITAGIFPVAEIDGVIFLTVADVEHCKKQGDKE